MDLTPKLQRKASLALSTRLNKKRHSESPQNLLKFPANCAINSSELNNNCDALQPSPSVTSICSDGGIESTPPRKKMAINLDESIEYSPKLFDSNFSPTCLLSQTLAIDSPEVGWKWNHHSVNGGAVNTAVRTPDSAYAADSSLASASSSSIEVSNGRLRGYSYKQQLTINARKEDRRNILEQEIRRVEKSRADEELKQRCAKLQEQLKSAGTQNKCTISCEEKEKKIQITSSSCSSNDVEIIGQSTSSLSLNAVEKIKPPEKLKSSELFTDFFNDSDLDSFLLEATQEIESKIEAQTQPTFIKFENSTPKSSIFSESTSLHLVNSASAASSTLHITTVENTSFNKENKDKSSSFYMKFIEDDFPDDWFVSLDQAISEATNNKKDRTSLQRYKSLPTETATNSNITVNTKNDNDETAASSALLSKIKRHSSTHTLSPSSTNP